MGIRRVPLKAHTEFSREAVDETEELHPEDAQVSNYLQTMRKKLLVDRVLHDQVNVPYNLYRPRFYAAIYRQQKLLFHSYEPTRNMKRNIYFA